MSLSNGLEKCPKLRFPEFQDEWISCTLGNIVKEDLYPIKKPKKDYTRLGIYCHGKGTFHELVPIDKALDVDTMYLVPKNSLIVNITFAWEHAIAVTNDLDEGKIVSHRFPTYSFNDDESPVFYKYLILRPRIKYLLGVASPGGAGRNRVLNKSLFLEIPVIKPSISEQKKISDFMSLIDQKIQKQQQLVELLKKYKKGVLKEIFNKDSNWNKNTKWKKTKLKNVGLIQTGTTPSTSVTEYYGNEYFWVTPSDILSKEILTTTKMLSEKGINKGRRIPANSVLATCIASIGKNTILRTVGSCNQQINSITPNENYDLEFLYYSICYNEPLMHEMAGSGGMEILNKQTFSELELYFPPIKEQRYFGTLLATFEESIEHEEKLINELHKTKQSLLQQLFI